MAEKRKQPYINVTWLRNYLIGDHLCRWSIWHRIYHKYEEAKSDFNRVQWSMEHATLRNAVQERYIADGFDVMPELEVNIWGQVAKLQGRIDLVAVRQDKNLIIEVKTGKPRESDKIQLMLYIWALPKTYGRFRGASFDGLIVYQNHEIEISALEVDEIFVKNFKQFTTDILSAEPNRKYPSPNECKWCRIGDCDERAEATEQADKSDYAPDFF